MASPGTITRRGPRALDPLPCLGLPRGLPARRADLRGMGWLGCSPHPMRLPPTSSSASGTTSVQPCPPTAAHGAPAFRRACSRSAASSGRPALAPTMACACRSTSSPTRSRRAVKTTPVWRDGATMDLQKKPQRGLAVRRQAGRRAALVSPPLRTIRQHGRNRRSRAVSSPGTVHPPDCAAAPRRTHR